MAWVREKIRLELATIHSSFPKWSARLGHQQRAMGPAKYPPKQPAIKREMILLTMLLLIDMPQKH
jgi:hypothetical protein